LVVGASRVRRGAVLALTVLAVAASSCSSSSHPGSSATVTIAVEGPMTGDQASTGQDMLRGAQLAATQLDATGGAAGEKVQVVAADDRADAATGVTVANAMVGRHVAGVVGPFNSSVGVANLPIYRAAGVPIVRLTSSNLTEGFGVTAQPMASQVAPVEAQELVAVLKLRSVAILYDPSTYTAGISNALHAALQQSGVAVPIDTVLPPGTDPAPALRAAAAARPDVLYLAMYGPQAGMVAAAAAAAHLGGRCFVDLAAQGPAFVQAAGGAGPGCLASGVPDAAQLPSGGPYVAAYTARFHQPPGTWGAFAYDSVMLLAAAARASGTWQGATLTGRLDRTSGYQGVTGTISIEPGTGNRVNPPVVVLDISASGSYGIDATWAALAHYR
jgi:branched-chain amino acid transport system substrate-binding protein